MVYLVDGHQLNDLYFKHTLIKTVYTWGTSCNERNVLEFPLMPLIFSTIRLLAFVP